MRSEGATTNWWSASWLCRGATRPIARLGYSIFAFGVGNSLVLVGLPLYVLDSYGVGLGIGLVLGLRVLPNIVAGPLVGEIIDRRDPLRISILAALANAALTLLTPLTDALWQLEALSVAIGVTTMFAGPARMALRSHVIPQGRELDGNGLIVTAEWMPAVLGPAVAGSALALAGFGWLFAAGSAAAALACLPLVGLRRTAVVARPATAETAERTDRRSGSWPQIIVRRLFIDNARSLSAMIGLDRMLVGLTVTAFTYVFALGVGRIFLSEYSVQRFTHLHGALGYLMAAMAAGGVVGGIATPRLKKAPPGLVYLAGCVLEGCCWLALTVVPTFPVAVALLALAGIFESSATVIFFAEVQIRLPDSFTGRYYAMFLPVCDAFLLAGSVTGGLVLLAGVNWAALIIAAAMIVPPLAYTIPFTRPPVPHLIGTGRTPAAWEGAG